MFKLIKKPKIILENAENFKITVIKFSYFFKYEQIGQFKKFWDNDSFRTINM